MPWRIGIYVFDGVEVLDFAGPFEVFSTASRVYRRLHPGTNGPFEVLLISPDAKAIAARGDMQVSAAATMRNHPPLDVLIIPGGEIEGQLERSDVVAWVAAQAQQVSTLASVCTGAFLLGEAGLLNKRRCTTHWEDITALRQRYPAAQVVSDARFIDEGALLSSAGISAGLDMSLYLVARLASRELAVRTARQMDYAWQGTPELSHSD